MTHLPPQPISPLDGRYRAAVEGLGDFLSEAGLNRARVHVEVEWLAYLTSHSLLGSAPLSAEDLAELREWAAGFGQADSEMCRLTTEELVGHLDEDPGAVARVGLAAGSAPVMEVFVRLEAVLDQLVRAVTLEVDHEANATGVVLPLRSIEALCGRPSRLTHPSSPCVNVRLRRLSRNAFGPRETV